MKWNKRRKNTYHKYSFVWHLDLLIQIKWWVKVQFSAPVGDISSLNPTIFSRSLKSVVIWSTPIIITLSNVWLILLLWFLYLTSLGLALFGHRSCCVWCSLTQIFQLNWWLTWVLVILVIVFHIILMFKIIICFFYFI